MVWYCGTHERHSVDDLCSSCDIESEINIVKDIVDIIKEWEKECVNGGGGDDRHALLDIKNRLEEGNKLSWKL